MGSAVPVTYDITVSGTGPGVEQTTRSFHTNKPECSGCTVVLKQPSYCSSGEVVETNITAADAPTQFPGFGTPSCYLGTSWGTGATVHSVLVGPATVTWNFSPGDRLTSVSIGGILRSDGVGSYCGPAGAAGSWTGTATGGDITFIANWLLTSFQEVGNCMDLTPSCSIFNYPNNTCEGPPTFLSFTITYPQWSPDAPVTCDQPGGAEIPADGGWHLAAYADCLGPGATANAWVLTDLSADPDVSVEGTMAADPTDPEGPPGPYLMVRVLSTKDPCIPWVPGCPKPTNCNPCLPGCPPPCPLPPTCNPCVPGCPPPCPQQPCLDVTGTVADQNGSPVSEEVDLLDADGNGPVTQSGSDGSYALTAPEAGTFSLVVISTADQSELSTPVSVIFDAPTPCPIVVDLTVTTHCLKITGTVRDQNGNPVDGVNVSLDDSNGHLVDSEISVGGGQYELNADEPGQYTLSVADDTNLRRTAEVTNVSLEDATPCPRVVDLDLVCGTCTPTTNQIQRLLQASLPWGPVHLDCPTQQDCESGTFGQEGCQLTCWAMIKSAITASTFTPLMVNDALNNDGTIQPEGGAYPPNVAKSLGLIAQQVSSNEIDVMEHGICSNEYIMVRVRGIVRQATPDLPVGSSIESHYVVITRVDNNQDTDSCDYRIADPGFNVDFLGGGSDSQVQYTVREVWRIMQ